MPSRRNIQAVEELKRLLQEHAVIIATGYQGLDVAAMTELRRRLREKGVLFRVVKNTLTRIAAQEVGKPVVAGLVEGPTALALFNGDPTEPARVLDEFVRTTRLPLVVRGAVIDGQALDAQAVSTLASLPPRPQLMADLMGRILSPLAGLVYVLSAPLQGLATVMQRYVEKEGGTSHN